MRNNLIYKKKIKELEKKLKLLKRQQHLANNLSKKSKFQEIQDHIQNYCISEKSLNSDPISEDFLRNSSRNPSGYRYSDETYSLSLLLQKSAPSSYDSVAPHLRLPSRQSIYKKYQSQINEMSQKLLNLENVQSIVKQYRITMGLSTIMFLDCILAVDAICFKPYVSITINGEITGIQMHPEKNPNLFQKFSLNPRKFEEFIRKNYQKSYSVGFVYQLQPLCGEFKNIVIHIQPAINGKATQKQIETLSYIRNIMKNVHINIKGFAFDGDNAYFILHTKYFNYYIHSLLNSNNIIDTIRNHLRIISDPLHILKRVRYRLLSEKPILVSFNTDNSIIDIKLIQNQLLKCPSVVFNNSKLTKMHDSLPLKLFSINSLKNLFELENKSALAYFTPWCLIVSAMENEKLSIDRFFDFLSISLYYLMYYFQSFQENYQNIRHIASEIKTQNKPFITMFDRKLVIESMNSLYSILAFISTEHFNVNIGRIGSTPLEHTFGKARIKAKYRHTLDNLTKCISIDQLLLDIKTINDIKIPKRIANFGRQVSFDPNCYKQYFKFENKFIAYILAGYFGLVVDDKVDFGSLANLFYSELFNVEFLFKSLHEQKVITINNVTLGIQNSLHSKQLIMMKSSLGESLKLYQEVKQKLNSLFGHRMLKNDLLLLAELTSKDMNIEITSENKKKKESLLKWFQENWNDISNFLVELAKTNHFQ